MESDRIRVDLLPELGGKIWNLCDARRDIQWLWHNPAVGLRRVALGASYDDHWAGGWEELFPNDAPGVFDGRDLPDHGEWWSQPWRWEIARDGPDRATVVMRLDGPTTGTACEKTVTVHQGKPEVAVHYRITNSRAEPLHFLFKQHLAVAVTPGHRVELPGGSATPVDLGFSTRVGRAEPFSWPVATDRDGRQVDLSCLPPPAEGHREFVYVRDMPEGWCRVREVSTGASLRLFFPPEVFPFTWLFMSFGGWRGLYTVVLEPCTNMPKDLHEAFRSGRCAVLTGHATLECEVRVALS
ncbi:MAG: DUF5107 domain-containing protein [Nitrospira sp.]|nr:DUF5107 domain-containing protein [Nitrospira sp.]